MATSLFLYFGNDEYRVTVAARETVDKLVPADRQALGLEIVDGRADNAAGAVSAIDRCLEAVRTVGFFGAGKVVWLRDANFFGDTRTGGAEAVKERVATLTEAVKTGLPDGQILVISADKVDKRFAFYKACSQAGEVHEFAVPSKGRDAEAQAADFVSGLLAREGLRMGRDVMMAFIARAGVESRTLAGEVEKLALYLGERKKVEVADVAAVSTGGRDILVWALGDAVGARDLPKALAALRQLLFQKENAIGLLFILQSKLRELILLREALDRKWLVPRGGAKGGAFGWAGLPPEAEALYAAMEKKDPRGIPPYRLGTLVEQARRFSTRELLRCRKAAVEAHETLVSSPVSEGVALELMLVRMLG
jgi:DNA polymerase-3 subunit delta